MKLEEVLGDVFLENVSPGPLQDQVREILEAFGSRKELGQLQVQSSWEDLVARNSFLVGRGFAFVEARMLGLLEPAFVMGLAKEGKQTPGRAGRPARLILVFVGTPVPSPAERALLSRVKAAIEDENWLGRLGQAKSHPQLKEILREVDRGLSAAVREMKPAKSSHAEILVNIQGDRPAEGDVRSAILKSGAAVEAVERGKASNGTREERITISFERGRSLDEIVHAVGKVEGVAVRTVTLFSSAPRPA